MPVKFIILDSEPLGLLAQQTGVVAADACRAWLSARVGAGAQCVVPEIIDYELRRELLRAGKSQSVIRLNQLEAQPAVAYLPLNTPAMRLAAALWAQLRGQGLPTAHPHALDVDVILAAQTLSAGFPPGEFVVATSNVGHISRLVPADLWANL